MAVLVKMSAIWKIQGPSDSGQMSNESDMTMQLEQIEKMVTAEIMEFEEEELHHDLLFSSHLSFAHTLQLVAKLFDV